MSIQTLWAERIQRAKAVKKEWEDQFKVKMARQYFDAADYVQARKGYDNLVQRDSTDVSSWLKLAEIASFRQQYPDAIEALNQIGKAHV